MRERDDPLPVISLSDIHESINEWEKNKQLNG